MHYLFSDGGSRGNPGISAIGAFVFDHSKKLVDFTGKYIGIATNNKAEYLALLNGIRLLKKLEIKEVICYLDSELVVKQLNGEYKIKNDDIVKLSNLIKEEVSFFKTITFKHVPRSENSMADKLVNLILDASIVSNEKDNINT